MKKLSVIYFIVLVVLIQMSTNCAQAQNINTFAGDNFAGYFGDDGPATAAELFAPVAVAVDNSGNVYIADEANNVIRKVNTSGIITTIAGNGVGAGGFPGGYSGDGGPATAAEFYYPDGITLDAIGNIYIADGANNVVRKVNTSGIISTIAGNGFDAGLLTGAFSGDGGAATAAEFYDPVGVAVDASGNVYIADWGNNRVRKVNTTGIITTIAGGSTPGYSGDGGLATAALLRGPTDVAVDNSGNIYIADQANDAIRKINTSGIISTIAGRGFGLSGYTGDGGPATLAELYYPFGVSVDPSGNVYIADELNNVIRKVNASGIISTIAGNNIAGYTGDGGSATNAELNNPDGIAVDNSGSVYIADEANNVIRKLGTIIGASGLCVGETATLTDITTGGTWSSSSTAVATINESSGLVTAVSAGVTTISYTLSGHDATTTFTVSTPPSAITGTLTVCSGAATTLSDAVAGGTWSSSSLFVAYITDPFFGIVTGESAGTAEITYSTSPGCFVDVTVNVLAGAAPISGFPEICIGTPSPFFGGTPGGAWSSSSTAIATVGATTGYVTGVSTGMADIIYTLSSGCTDSEEVEVSPAPAAGAITGTTTVCVGSTVILSDTATGGFWNSASGGMVANADFETGVVMGVSAGPDIISYTVDNDCGEATATIAFTVEGYPDAGIVTGVDSVCLGYSIILSDASAGGTWNSGSSTIATISSSGTVYGADDGTVDIIYTVANSCSSVSAFFPITVVSDGACITLGTGKVTKPASGQLLIFPNPNDGTFSINILSDIDEQAQVVITNVVGEKVMEFTTPVNKIVPVTLQSAKGAGIYLLSATTNSGKYVAKVMVE